MTTPTYRNGPVELAEDSYRLFRDHRKRPVFAGPTASRQLLLACIQRYQSHTARRRLYQALVGTSLYLGLDAFISTKVANPLSDWPHFDLHTWKRELSSLFHSTSVQVSFFWPSEPKRARIYAHLFDSKGRSIAFAKIAFDQPNACALAREANALPALPHLPPWLRVPALIRFREQPHFASLVMSVLPDAHQRLAPTSTCSISLPRLVRSYARRPTRVGKREVLQLTWWQAFESKVAPHHAHFVTTLLSNLKDGALLARVHGDLGAHNMLQDASCTWVFDWENSDPLGPTLTDVIGFRMAKRLRQARSRPQSYLRWFQNRILAGRSCRTVTAVMLAIAYRYVVGIDDADLVMRNWKSIEGQI